MIDLSKLLIVGIIGLFLAGSVVLIYDAYVGEEDNNIKEEVVVTIPPKATQTTPSGEVITAEKTLSGVKVTSTTGETKYVNIVDGSKN